MRRIIGEAGMIKQGRTSMALESVKIIIEKLNCPIEQALEFVAVNDEERQYVMKTLGSEKKE